VSSISGRSYRFSHALTRVPTTSVAAGLRAAPGPDPDPEAFLDEHADYVTALETAGLSVTTLPGLDAFPDATFIEDAALCLGRTAMVLRPGAPTRAGEATVLATDLHDYFDEVLTLGDGHVDGGDILVTDNEVIVGTSERTNRAGIAAVQEVLAPRGYNVRAVETPPGVLHLKTDCAVVDADVIWATERLAASSCFADYRVLTAPEGEEAAANLIRVNDTVLVRTGFPDTATKLRDNGYNVATVNASQAALVDGGLSCLSLRYLR